MELIGIEGRFLEMPRQSGGHGNPPAAERELTLGFRRRITRFTPRDAQLCAAGD